MPSLRQRIAKALLKEDTQRLDRATHALVDIAQRWPSIVREGMTTDERAAIGELDARYIDLMSRQLQYNFGQPAGYEATESDRRVAIDLARRAYDNDVLAEAINDSWTSFGFGTSVDVSPRDPAAKVFWDAFWHSPQNAYILNQKRVQDLSTYLLRDGDYLLVCYISTLDGSCIVRRVNGIEVMGGPQGNGIICMPDDREVPVFYRRQVTANGNEPAAPVQYLRDWRATDAMVEAVTASDNWHFEDGAFMDEVKPETRVMALHVAHKVRTLRGWPLMTTGLPWSQAYKNFLQDRAAIARAAAMYFEKMKVKGGQRVVDQLVGAMQSSLTLNSNTYETNPIPAAGARMILNDQVDVERFPMGTGSGDAETDGAMLKAQAALAGRMPSHWLGSGKDVQWATAQEMRIPVLRALNGYGLFWAATWAEMAEIVLHAAEQYNPKMAGKAFATYEVDVNTDAMLTMDLDQIIALMAEVEKAATDQNFDKADFATVYDTLARLALQTLGVKNVDDVLPIDQKPSTAQTGGSPVDPGATLLDKPGTDVPVPLTAVWTRLQRLLRDIPTTKLEELLNMAEAKPFGPEAYLRGLKRGVVGLWNGALDTGGFYDIFTNAIEVGLTDAFYAGAAELGMGPEDISPTEKAFLAEIISKEYGFVAGFGEEIAANNKAAGGQQGPWLVRLQQWARRWGEVHDQALVLLGKDEKLEWTLGDSEHSPDCLKLDGKVKRASQWKEAGLSPRSPLLDCGLGCKCSLVKTDKPISKGPLPTLAGPEKPR